jgi:hypothetical protein
MLLFEDSPGAGGTAAAAAGADPLPAESGPCAGGGAPRVDSSVREGGAAAVARVLSPRLMFMLISRSISEY